MAGRFSAWWADTPKPVRWTVYTAVPTGVGALILGLVGDWYGWWKDREFLTNLLSSFTGLLLGVPFALVVLSHLGAIQADAANRRAAIHRGREAALQFVATVRQGFVNPASLQREADLIRLRTENYKLKKLLPSHLEIADVLEKASEIRRQFDLRERAIESTFRLRSGLREGWIAQIAQDWERLDRDVRPRLEEVGGRWMSADAYADLRKAGKQLDSLSATPMRGLRRTMQAIDQVSSLPRPSEASIMRTVETLRQDTEVTHDAVLALLDVVRNVDHVDRIGS
ncbi:hypothetical protein [Streptomyces sp. NPDC058656]|uniref:hypothetical protein n=1 Tax=unclassified Streptomyces TaxID=2593676 RepID=UPI0036623AF8